jgi:hypothetical protein
MHAGPGPVGRGDESTHSSDPVVDAGERHGHVAAPPDQRSSWRGFRTIG